MFDLFDTSTVALSHDSLRFSLHHLLFFFFFFFNDTATTEIYTLSLHDALPISNSSGRLRIARHLARQREKDVRVLALAGDRKSTRLNSSHGYISYAVFCLKKKKKNNKNLHGINTE